MLAKVGDAARPRSAGGGVSTSRGSPAPTTPYRQLSNDHSLLQQYVPVSSEIVFLIKWASSFCAEASVAREPRNNGGSSKRDARKPGALAGRGLSAHVPRRKLALGHRYNRTGTRNTYMDRPVAASGSVLAAARSKWESPTLESLVPQWPKEEALGPGSHTTAVLRCRRCRLVAMWIRAELVRISLPRCAIESI